MAEFFLFHLFTLLRAQLFFSISFRLPFHALVSIFEFVFNVRSILSHKKAYLKTGPERWLYNQHTGRLDRHRKQRRAYDNSCGAFREEEKTSTTKLFSDPHTFRRRDKKTSLLFNGFSNFLFFLRCARPCVIRSRNDDEA